MPAVFKNHIIICNWNRRGKTIVASLRTLSSKPILIVCENVNLPIEEIGKLENVFVLAGDPTTEMALKAADVGSAMSVLILASEKPMKGDDSSADAESVKIALLVEQIEVSVYTVVELLSLENRPHFAWTKVDDLVADQDLAIRLIAQGVRHIITRPDTLIDVINSILLMEIYEQLINPLEKSSQLFQVTVPFDRIAHLSFLDILKIGLSVNSLPTALIGYVKHKIKTGNNEEDWISWKMDIQANPPPEIAIRSIWPEWPGQHYELGIVVIATSYTNALTLPTALAEPL